MAGGIYLEIDASELDAQIDRLKSALTPARVNQVMYGIFQRTGGHVRRILKEDLPKQYYIKPGEVGKAVGRATVTSGAGGTGCVIPISGPKKSIGGGFSASGGARGWASLRRRYRVKARIVKSGQSTLPQQMDSYGGQAPFRNLGPSLRTFKDANGNTIARGAIGPDGAFEKYPKSSLGKQVFTRAGKGRLPILKVVGISVAQMPTNRSESEVQADIKAYLEKRMEHELQRLIGG